MRLWLGFALLILLGVVGYAFRSGPGTAPVPPSQDVRDADRLVEQLDALGYVTPVTEDPDPEQTGVTRFDASRATAGVNVYCSVLSKTVHFMDMHGRELHTLTLPATGRGQDCMVEADRAGGFIALAMPHVTSLNLQSDVAWVSSAQHHHDLFVSPERDVYTFSERPGVLSYRGHRMNIRDQAIVVLSPEGESIREPVLFSEVFGDLIPDGPGTQFVRFVQRKEEKKEKAVVDAFHPNAIELLDRDIGVARPGNALVCLRNLNMIAILDLEREEVIWSWGPGELQHPHHPSVLPNGNVLVLDNGRFRKHSRVIELDPRAKRIVWEYSADPPSDFFTSVRGSLQAFPNGNVLVTESTKGRVFEITRAGEVVWEFWNPEKWPPTGARRQIYRMWRLTPTEWEALRAGITAPTE